MQLIINVVINLADEFFKDYFFDGDLLLVDIRLFNLLKVIEVENINFVVKELFIFWIQFF